MSDPKAAMATAAGSSMVADSSYAAQRLTRVEPLGFDEPFRRLREFHLSYCEASFRAQSLDVNLIAFQGR